MIFQMIVPQKTLATMVNADLVDNWSALILNPTPTTTAETWAQD